MNLIEINCSFCGKKFWREQGRVNEVKKFGWNQYCSKDCQNKSQLRGVEKECANPACHKLVYLSPHEFKKTKFGLVFCSQSCAATVNNSKSPKRQRQVKIKICSLCDKEFTGEGILYCSPTCQHKAQVVTKKKIYKEIREFYKKHKRIPLKRESHHYCAARNRFGTWNKAIAFAGFKPNPVLFARKHTANDGHKCDSLSEKIIDDWLYTRKIQHKRAVPYPENPSLTVDFVIKNNWIEFFGLAGDLKEYDRLLKKKQILAKKHKLSLLEIYPKDLFPVNRLSEIIKVKEI